MTSSSRSMFPAATILIALAAAATLLVPPTARGDCSDYQSSIRWVFGESFVQYAPGYGLEGAISGFARDGNKVLLTGDTGTVVLVESAPDQYAYGGRVDSPGYKVAARPNRAYVAGNDFYVLNTTDPYHSTVIATLPNLGLNDLVVANSYAYAASFTGLTIIDLHEPAIRVIGTIGLYQGWARTVTIYGNRVYLVTSEGLKVIDVSVPSAPVLLTDAYPSTSLVGVARQGAYLYVTDDQFGLRIFSLADPNLPHLVAGVPVQSAASVVVGGTWALVGSSYQVITVVDIGDPAAPVTMGAYGELDLGAGEIQPDGGDGPLAYLATGWMGFQVLDLGNGSGPSPIRNVPEGAHGRDLRVENGVLSLVTVDRLRTFDVTDPANPVPLGSLPLAYPWWLAVSGETAYVEDNNGLEVIDLSVPATPTILATLPSNHTGEGVASGNRLYETQNQSVWTYDITDPHAPVLLGVDGAGDWIDCAVADGNWLYTGVSFEGNGFLTKLDMTDPSNIRSVGWGMVEFGVSSLALDREAGKLIVSAGTAIHFLDTNDLFSDQMLGDHSFGGSVVLGSEGRIYVGTSDGAFRVVSYDGSPHYLGSGVLMDRFNAAPGIAEVGGTLYMTGHEGLYLIAPPCDPTAAPVPAAAPRGLCAAPNPFTAETSLRFDLSAPAVAGLRVFDPAGRLVRTLLPTAALGAGAHFVTWDGRNEAGRALPAGVYLARIGTAPGEPAGQRTVRIVLR